MVGPIPVGVNRFQFQADAPQADSIPASDILGVTVILLTCSYDDKEFIRVGYYQNNEYPEGSEERRLWEEKLEKKEKITSVDISKVVRNILADKPKVTRFNIKWYDSTDVTDVRDNVDTEDIEYPPPQPLDGEIDRVMETDEQDDFVVSSESAIPGHEPVASSSIHPASEPVGETTVNEEDIESDDDDEEEEEAGDISLGEEEEEIDEEEEVEGDEDEEMQDADADVADEDVTMQSVEANGPTNLPVAQTA